MINVLHIIETNIRGGIFKVFQDIEFSFKNNNNYKIIVLGKDDKDEFNKAVWNSILIKDKFVNIFEYYSVIKKNSIKIIHLHGFDINIFILSFLIKMKIIYTNHGLLGTGRKLKKYEYIKKWILIYFLRNKVNYIINISKYAQERLINEYKVNINKTYVVYNCSRWEVKNIKNNIDKREIYLGFHGRFAQVKRIERLLKVSEILIKNYGQENTVHLIGDGPLKESYINYSIKKEIKLKIINYLMNPQDEVIYLDFLIVPSDEEYFGLSIIEGIRCGIFSFVFINGGGCVEIFPDFADWFICKSENEMAEKIIFAINNYDKVVNMFRDLQKYVIEKFSVDNFQKGYVKIYDKFIEKVI
jgi:glycosyltransferase involved in cell wall biosynthesis